MSLYCRPLYAKSINATKQWTPADPHARFDNRAHNLIALSQTYQVSNNDNDKRLGLTAKADQPDQKKYSTLKIKMDNEAVQKLHTS